MPRFPAQSETAAGIRASVFARLAEGLKRPGLIPLHIGDTHLPPPEGARWERRPLLGEELYRYGEPSGLASLRRAVVADLIARGVGTVSEDCVQVHAGATHALTCAARAILEPGDDVIIPAPYWPLIAGIVRSAGARPIEVPFYQTLYQDPAADPAAILAPHLTPRTAALYLTSPNNPDGKVLSATQQASIAALARAHDLWVLSDEVYRDYLYVPAPHVSIALQEGMRERTAVATSFSKSHALAGDRVGVLWAPPDLIRSVRKIANHSLFNVAVPCQLGALGALAAGDAWVQAARDRYRAARDLVHARLPLPMHLPEGGAYVFARVGDDAYPFLERALEAGVALAPGDGFGEAFRGYVRLCFTAVREDVLEDALARLASVL